MRCLQSLGPSVPKKISVVRHTIFTTGMRVAFHHGGLGSILAISCEILYKVVLEQYILQVHFPLQIVIPPLFHTHGSLLSWVYGSCDQAGHYHILDL
jgi:hypothetical protein